MAQTALAVANRAIYRAGGVQIDDFDENTPLAEFCKTEYPSKRRFYLALHRWVFANRLAQLNQLATTPADCPMAKAFSRPANLVGQIWDFRDGPSAQAAQVRVIQMGDYIAADSGPLWAEFTGDQGEASWPDTFEEFVVAAFAIEIARKLGKRSLATDLTIEAYGPPEDRGDGGLLLTAKQKDGVNAPQRALGGGQFGPACYTGGGALVDARFGAGVAGGYGLGLVIGSVIVGD